MQGTWPWTQRLLGSTSRGSSGLLPANPSVGSRFKRYNDCGKCEDETWIVPFVVVREPERGGLFYREPGKPLVSCHWFQILFGSAADIATGSWPVAGKLGEGRNCQELQLTWLGRTTHVQYPNKALRIGNVSGTFHTARER